jgi:hypothetical protein
VNRALVALAIGAVLSGATVAQSLEGWRTPDGELYFGSAPPLGSTRIEGVRPRRTPPPSAPRPTATPRSTATSRPSPLPTPTPTARPPVPPRPTRTPAEASSLGKEPPITLPRQTDPVRAASSDAPSPSEDEPACGDIVALRDTRPTIDFEADRVVITGEVLVTTRPVRDLLVCLAGSCAPVAAGKVLAEGETARFRVAASGTRRRGLSVQCSVIPLP